MFIANKQAKAIKICQTAIDWLLLSLVFLLPLFFSFIYQNYSVFVLYRVLILRTFISIVILLFLAKIFLAGQLKYRFSKIFFALALLLAFSWLFSSSFSIIPAFSFWGQYNRQQGFFTLIFYLLFFLLLLLNLDIFKAKRFVWAMLTSSLLACLYGVSQVLYLDPIRWSEPFAVMGRIFSTFGQPNFFGHFLIMVIPFSVYALFFLARGFLSKLSLIVLLFGQLFCLTLTYSRSAFIGLAIEIFLFLLIFLFLRGWKKIALGLAIFSLLGAILVCSFSSHLAKIAVYNVSVSARITTAFDFSQGSVRVRLNIWQAALDEFKQESVFRKFFGYGPDSLFEPFAKHYQAKWALDETMNIWPDRAHNLFLDIILSFGLFGLAVYLVIFIYFFQRCWKFFKTAPRDNEFWLAIACVLALAGYFFNNLFSFSDVPQYLYFYLILALLAFILFRSEEEKEIKVGLSVFSRLAILISFSALAAIFIFYFNIRPVWADYYFTQAVKIVGENCSEALDYNKKAISWGMGNNLFYQGEYINIGLGCFKRLSGRESQEKLKDNLLFYASTLPAENYFFFAKYKVDMEAMLAENYDKAYYPLAEKDFAALAQKYPRPSNIYENWANLELKKGDNDAAIKIANDGLAVLPLKEMEARGSFSHRYEIEGQLSRFYNIISGAYEKKKAWDSAILYYKKIISLNPFNLPIYKKIADIYYQQKDLDKALWYNEKGYRLGPNDYVWPLAIGILYQEKGDKEKAKDYLSHALELAPEEERAEIEQQINGLKQ